MNRKMRAKVNNAAARQKKARREQKLCDKCGKDVNEHLPVVLLKLTPIDSDERPSGVTLQ